MNHGFKSDILSSFLEHILVMKIIKEQPLNNVWFISNGEFENVSLDTKPTISLTDFAYEIYKFTNLIY